MNSDLTHYTTFPFAMTAGLSGGLPSVFMAEARQGRAMTILSTDEKSCSWEGAEILAAQPDTDLEGLRFTRWFNIDWALLHPDAYTSVAAPHAALQEMYEQFPSEHPIGSIERMIEFCDRVGPALKVETDFNTRFDSLLERVAPGSVMNWQDYFFAPSISKHADMLRSRGVYQTWHLHTTLPDSLHLSEWGRGLLAAISKVDVLFVHTDEYARRIQLQLEGLQLPCPQIRRFNLGIDQATMSLGLQAINSSNYDVAIPGFAQLKEAQQTLIHEVFRSRGTIPHRFFCLDRADPGKGIATVLDGIEAFLDEKRARGASLQDLQSEYRFFFLHQLFNMSPLSADNLMHSYIGFIRKRHAELQSKFPGVIFVSPELKGSQRTAVPALLLGCHGITGGAQDGLNLAVQENAWVNRELDTTVISGSGTGFAIQAKAQGLESNGFFPVAGDATGFHKSIENIVATQSSNPGELGTRKHALVKFIESRRDRMLVRPGE